MSLHFINLDLSLRVELADEVLAQHSVASAQIVGTELALVIDNYVREHALGYYPALDYFRSQGGIDTELLDAEEGLAWLACRLVREEIQKKLRAAFSTMRFLELQSTAYSMPTIRPGQSNALNRLGQHYSTNFVKVDMAVSLIQKQPADDNLLRYARQVTSRWLRHSFKGLEVQAFLAE